MNIQFLMMFILMSFVNVFGSTIKTLTQLKCNKTIASATSAIYYGFYTIVLLYTVSDGIPLWLKVCIVAACNFFGTYLANMIFETATKENYTWRITVSVPTPLHFKMEESIECGKLEYRSYGEDNGWYMYDVFCKNKNESSYLRDKCITAIPDAKYIISESVKTL